MSETKIPHIPVLFNEVIETFKDLEDGYVIDCTLGYGGHSLGILESNPNIKLICNDQDDEALNFSKNRLKEYANRIIFSKGNFKDVINRYKDKNIVGILADIGVSSLQLDKNDRGFGFNGETLDMRMDQNQELSANEIVNEYAQNDLEKILKFNWYWVLVNEVEQPEKYWIFKVDTDENIKEIIEKPEVPIGKLANLWVYKFDSKIFEIVDNIPLSPRWEYEITDAINDFVKLFPFKAFKIEWEFIDVWYPWDILTSNAHFLNKLWKSNIKWIVEEWVTIKWNIVLEEWSVLKSWTYIEWNIYIWKWSSIWPNTYLRWNTVIWDNCKVWNAVEVKNSSIWDNTNIAHLSYVWDSIVWNNVNIGWWFITANLRHDKGNIKVPINGKYWE